MRFTLKTVIGIAVMLLSHPLDAQSWEDVKADSGRYIWADGWGRSIDEADNEALSALAGKISLTVVSEFRSVEGQTTAGRQTSRYSSVDHNLRSFSSASLCNSGVEVLESGRRAHVVRWVSREEIERMKSQRSAHVLEYVRNAQKSERSGRFSDALRGYYWAYAMIVAYPELSSVSFHDIQGESHALAIWLQQRISGLLSGLRVAVVTLSERQAVLSFSYNGMAAQGVEFTFFDGIRWSEAVRAQDGRRTVYLSYNSRPDYIHIRLEHLFMNDINADRELQYALESVKDEPMIKAYIACR